MPTGRCAASSSLTFEDMGSQQLKNIASPVRVYAIQVDSALAPARAHPELPDKPSIAVLPFDNMSAEAGQEYLADGIVEAITAALSRIRSFFVIARNSAFTYKGRAVNVRDIGKRARRRLRDRGQRAEGRQPSAHHRPAGRDRNRRARVGPALRRHGGRHLRSAGPHHRAASPARSSRRSGSPRSSARAASGRRTWAPTTTPCRAMPHVWALEKDRGRRGARSARTGAGDRPRLSAGAVARRLVPRPALGLQLGRRHRGKPGQGSRRWPSAPRSSAATIRSSWQCSARSTPSCAITAPRASCSSAR